MTADSVSSRATVLQKSPVFNRSLGFSMGNTSLFYIRKVALKETLTAEHAHTFKLLADGLAQRCSACVGCVASDALLKGLDACSNIIKTES